MSITDCWMERVCIVGSRLFFRYKRLYIKMASNLLVIPNRGWTDSKKNGWITHYWTVNALRPNMWLCLLNFPEIINTRNRVYIFSRWVCVVSLSSATRSVHYCFISAQLSLCIMFIKFIWHASSLYIPFGHNLANKPAMCVENERLGSNMHEYRRENHGLWWLRFTIYYH